MTTGVHHLHWIESDALVVGYMNTSCEFEPSLALASIDVKTKSVAVVCDLKEPVCSNDKTDLCCHRYITRYLPNWWALVTFSILHY